MTSTASIIDVLAQARLSEFADELRLQDAIERVLKGAEHAYEREVVLAPGDRIDFLVGNIGIEVKVEGSPTEVVRQLIRYADSPRVARLVLVTARARLAARVPASINGKPIATIATWRAGL